MAKRSKKKVIKKAFRKVDDSEMFQDTEEMTFLKDDIKDLLIAELRASLYQKVDEIIYSAMETIDRSLEIRIDAIKTCLDKVKK